MPCVCVCVCVCARRAALERLGLPCTPEYLVTMMNEYDLNRDNHIDWDEFRWVFKFEHT